MWNETCENIEKVSVVVVTYNSAETICKTLDSIFNQTYANIELIVQDDASNDFTVNKVKKWAREKDVYNRFSGFSIFANEENIGTSKNIDKACKKATGKWIKTIGGDDLLVDDCIEMNMLFVNEIHEDALIMSDIVEFYEDSAGDIITSPIPNNMNTDYLRKFNIYDAKKQYQLIMRSYKLSAPTFFFSKKGLDCIGGFDTRYELMEDWPFVIRWTKKGKCIRYMERVTVYYRMGGPNTVKGTSFFNIKHEACISKLKMDEIYPYISALDVKYWLSELMMKIDRFIMINIFNNQMTKTSTAVNYIITWFIPYNWNGKIHVLKNIKLLDVIKRWKWNLRNSK